MRSLILDHWIRIKSSYWFIPALMCIAAAMLASVAVTHSDLLDSRWIAQLSWLYSTEPEGARALLATVAGSMITVAGVVFSMTLLMVSHASAQIGPRVIEGFMRDRGSQVVLGTFIATFIYCLLVLRTVTAEPAGAEAGGDAVFVPHLAILIAVALSIMSVAVLIYFVHHVPIRINVTSVIDRIACSILHQLDNVYPKSVGDGKANPRQAALPAAPQQTVCLDGKGGYLRIIDDTGLMTIASDKDCALEILVNPGAFCVRGTPVVNVYRNSLDDDTLSQIEDSFSWGGSRTQEQDILFLVDQLAEISGRALSSGVNDQFTAIACIDHMERVIRESCERDDPSSDRIDGDGELRIVANGVTRTQLVNRFLVPLRQFSYGDALVTTHLLAMLSRAVKFAEHQPDLQRTLNRHIEEMRAEAVPSIEASTGLSLARQQLVTPVQARGTTA